MLKKTHTESLTPDTMATHASHLLLTVDACIACVESMSGAEQWHIERACSAQRACLDLYKSAQRKAERVEMEKQDLLAMIKTAAA